MCRPGPAPPRRRERPEACQCRRRAQCRWRAQRWRREQRRRRADAGGAGGAGHGDPVTNPDHGVDQRRVAELASQRHHRDPYRRGERVGVGVPDAFEQLLARDHPAARLEQLLQQAELLAGQVERLPCAGRGACRLVEHHIRGDQHRRRRRRGPPTQRPDPGHQLVEGERLGQVVVGAELQPLDPVGDRTARGEHQHPGQRAGRHQVGADLVAVDTRQVPVQHHDVVPGHQGHLVSRRSVGGDVDGEPLAPQPARDGLGQGLFVLDHEHPHVRTSRCRA
jgi:D-alanyl-D-alanine carboxypeptidase/D-alanyl-D-alanine-endopeptidase (penicillin-binding protein 4)